MGRKKTLKPRKNRVQIRLNDDELRQLKKHVKKETGKNVLGAYIRKSVMEKISNPGT